MTLKNFLKRSIPAPPIPAPPLLTPPPSLDASVLTAALNRPDPVLIETRPGETADRIDRLPLIKDEDCGDVVDIWERMQIDARTDPVIADLFDTFHLWGSETDRMNAFVELGVGKALAEFIGRFGVKPEHSIADVGCGSGWLAYSLNCIGYKDLVAMEPNAGATMLLKRLAGDRIEIINDLDIWRGVRNRFDALVSMATVHHWEHIPWIAIEARRTMKPGAYWFAVMEWFADTPAEFVEAMNGHPTRERYKMYEWAYPASAYVDLIQSVGFTLNAVVPMYYRNNAYMTVGAKAPLPDTVDQDALNRLVDENLTGPNGTVELFWAEVDARRRAPGYKMFTRPQVMVFQRTAVD